MPKYSKNFLSNLNAKFTYLLSNLIQKVLNLNLITYQQQQQQQQLNSVVSSASVSTPISTGTNKLLLSSPVSSPKPKDQSKYQLTIKQ